MEPLEIDGSHGEGGGQLTRLAVALAAMTGRPLRLVRIRARRARPGLRPQHLAAVRAIATLCDGSLSGDAIGSGELHFKPGRIRGGTYRFDVGTAGSIALVLQAILPVALRAAAPSLVTIAGGTDVPKAPPLDYLRLVFLPLLGRMGAEVGIDLLRRGYYPRGGGEVQVRIPGVARLDALRIDQPGPVQAIRGVAHVANLPPQIAERMSAAARESLGDLGPAQIETQLLGEAEAVGRGGVPAERLGSEVGWELRRDLEGGAGVDIHAADQLLIYAAQATRPSVFTVRHVSLHAATVMWLTEQFLPARFSTSPWRVLQRIEVSPDRA